MLVSDIYADAEKILGTCDQAKILDRLTEAVDILTTHGEFDPLVGHVDICTDGLFVSLPREVETVLALNINGRPAVGRDSFFTFHYNGPGDCGWQSCDLSWQDLGNFPTFRDIKCPSKLVAFVDKQEDEGAEVWVYGFDQQGNEVRTQIGSEWKRGYLVPTIYGYALPASDAPTFSRVTGIRKDPTAGVIRISSFDTSTYTGTLLAIMDWDDEESVYRRIKLSRNCGDWVRLKYRKRLFKLRYVTDPIPVRSQAALKMMLRAVKYYDEADIGTAEAYEATAARLESQKQMFTNPPTQSPIQVDDTVAIQDKGDYID